MSSASAPQDSLTDDAQKISVETEQIIDKVAELILNCDAILFTSGAGMGVGSGLGTFRGIAAGVWPPLQQHPELDFTDMSNPSWFHQAQGNSSKHDTANFGYAFWAFRYDAYTSAAPHHGYLIAKQWSELSHIKSAFSFTSNIDGHWIKSGWKESLVLECHGSIDYMQCVKNCNARIWPTNNALKLTVDPKTNCVTDPLPLCPDCHKLARPNVLMFGDWEYIDNRLKKQQGHYDQFKSGLAAAKSKLLIIELGAGTAVPTVRFESERTFVDPRWAAHFIRINPFAEHVTIDAHSRNKSKGQALELSLDALTALTLIDKALKKKQKQ
ncbi:unnamed protein product [Didymodactylos carnosus]|uniref:Deacetylase sirtuin-type domain-containing protein n=2 Tax=Didymodactylos carnosus TaxID=1234261 RepID=A0A814RJ89_9BILA|nr:unnamed protein product [Didymodactylos carnosus]CAF3897745.1 unnamed protein product [Didymodactylos carnosus]